ncbi:alcohol dehydrogenase catalytic domain-containing protein [Micromonospora sp. WMMD882]|uniref:alcohol dehydrogenase catalytic domain-containing protein n=1 Tax=Micromonospora sp. WMMD882 TaxID=3015151 RepID=UPI00248C8409|nr:alcohol dehydrogenase catalytic domain-containing protein [Micromonospora sp. WMMD882]WBB80398.1 alcohol dehydrogenase catalytic domain-containing protein [Micromonospora sp. WMMD882]
MRCVLAADGPRLTTDPPRRPPGEHAVRVRVELVGLCRSDLKEVAGERHGPSQFGHEIVGVVEESTLAALPPGRRVGLDPNVPVDRGTGFATAMWAAGPADLLVAALPVVPADGDPRRLVFAEPLACAAHCLRAATGHLGRGLGSLRVAVLGAGTAGVLIAGAAHAQGAEVALGNRSADRTTFLRRRRVLDVPVGALTDLPSDDVDLAVVATSFVLPEVLAHALRVVRPGGLALLYGGTAPGDRLPGLDCDLDTVRRAEAAVATCWQGKPVRVGGSYGTAPQDFAAAVGLLTGPDPATLPVERMITNEIPLTDLADVLREQAAGRRLGKTVVWPDRPPPSGGAR